MFLSTISMVSFNGKAQGFTLKACFKKDGDLPPLVIREQGTATLISELKTIFLFFGNADKCCKYTLKRILGKFLAHNKFSLNVDVVSFRPVAHCATLRAIIETALWCDHQPFTLKKKLQRKSQSVTLNLVYPESMAGGCDIKSGAGTDQAQVMTADELFKLSAIKMQYVNLARDWQDMPPNVCFAPELAKMMAHEAAKIPGLKVTVLNKSQIKTQNMNLLLAVNSGSKHDPRVVILEYNGKPRSQAKTAIVGKGVTFDTGGYNLKPSTYMKGMKMDMSGAAIASSTVMAIAKAKLKINVCGVACLVENAIGAEGTIPESVITSKNGKTVQIDNTDAEGRLILADGITYAIREIGNIEQIIEMSTLTGAILVALGNNLTGAFVNDNQRFAKFAAAADRAQEELWRMPFNYAFDKKIETSPIADITNCPDTRYGGACLAAAFLKQFTENKPFIHLDIAGSASAGSGFSERGTGVMLRTIFDYLQNS